MTEPRCHLRETASIKHLDSAVAEVFEMMLGVACLPTEQEISFPAGLQATIRLTGKIEGHGRLCLSPSATQAAMKALLDEQVDESDAMLEDTAGELCNMIFGSWKSRLPAHQASALLSIPVASYGDLRELGEPRLYSFNGNLLALALLVRESEPTT